jgi:DNA-binding LytR/AlgR family response regulator
LKSVLSLITILFLLTSSIPFGFAEISTTDLMSSDTSTIVSSTPKESRNISVSFYESVGVAANSPLKKNTVIGSGIIIESENKSESIKVDLNNVLLIKSANNYIEVFWKKDDEIHKKLIRNTLTKVENQLKIYPNFIRCHRTALVNKSFILKLTGGSQGHQIRLEGLDELIPVSRQYALKVKEQINR